MSIDNAIQDFLDSRKGQKVIKDQKNAPESEHIEIQETADQMFLLNNWLPDAVRRGAALEISTHPGKFVHPSAKISAVIARAESQADGFLRSGNVESDIDVFGSSASLDVSKFLSLSLFDGRSVQNHLDQNTDYIREQLSIENMPFDEIREGLLVIQKAPEALKTSDKIKQVYFPVESGYHLLSLLIPSGIIFKLKERINVIRFSEEAKQAREDRRNKIHNPLGFDDLYDLTVIGYGGANPQNISELNAQNNGKAYLLPSLPPQIENRSVRSPKYNFFTESLFLKRYESSFSHFHEVLVSTQNDKSIRLARDRILTHIIDSVFVRVWQIRTLESGWTENTDLPLHHRILLDDFYMESRNSDELWLKEIVDELAKWIVLSYDSIVSQFNEKPVQLQNEEVDYIKMIVEKNKEGLL
ncbi:type I-F CRISPR-associated protein Csy1 [Methylomonas sp. AM2-LC]|uniref:type I-F CRISPR-associated protein Csy1 n=1 Tax=Methylomonas sp. AM2-LC TaxID=3153301 RepID=UPI003264E8C4